MKKLLYKATMCTALVTWLHTDSIAQQGVTISNDAFDIRFVGKTNTNSQGTPYLYENWNNGTVKLADGTVYKNMELIFDIMYNELIFKGDNGQPLAFEKTVQEFTFNFTYNGTELQRTFRNGFTAVDGGTAETYYEILSDGKIKLLKKYQKKMTESREAGSILATKKLAESTGYYIFTNNELKKIKKDKKLILTLLNNKAQEVNTYITANNVDVKNEDGLVRIFNYYNRLM